MSTPPSEGQIFPAGERSNSSMVLRSEDLPAKVKTALQNVLLAGERPIMAFKTAWKPNSEIPTLWVAYTNLRFFLFSTRQRGKLFREALFADINSMTTEHKQRKIRVLLWSPGTQDMVFPVSESVSASTVEAFVQAVSQKAWEARSQ